MGQGKKKRKKGAQRQGTERRQHRRLPVCARVRWLDESNEEFFCFTRDLSAAGLFLLTDHPPPLDQKLALELSVQYLKEPITINGRVVRLEADEGRAVGCGVTFLHLDPQIQQILDSI